MKLDTMLARLLFTLCALVATGSLLAQSELVIVKEGTSEYHRPGCDIVRDGVGVVAMTRAQAEARKLKAHPACDPANAPADPAEARAKPPAIVYVYVDDAGKHYHKDKCKRLGKNRKKITVDAAAKKHWPCPVCKPPIRKRPPR
jgi:hypothetical protein